MRITLLIVAAALLAGVVVTGCGDSKEQTAEAACICEKGKAGETVWCEKCGAGYVGGDKTACQGCYQAKQGGPACEDCAAKACVCAEGKAGGTVWCEKCGSGYVEGEKSTCQGCVTAKLGGNECATCAGD